MQLASRLAGIGRGMAGTIRASYCSCASASASLHVFLTVYGGQKQQLPCASANISCRVPAYDHHRVQIARFGRRSLKASSGNWFTLGHSHKPAATGSRGSTCTSIEVLVPVRCMGSLKTKDKPRGPLWRTRSVISRETVQAVHDLKRNKNSPHDLEKVFRMRISRLLKVDMLATLDELQRQGEVDLALRLFDFVKKEMWYKPDKFMYQSMMDALGRARRIPEIENKFQELQDEGITPEVVIYRELVGAYVRADMLPQALEAHAKMFHAGYGDDPLTLHFIETAKKRETARLKRQQEAAEDLKSEEQQEEAVISETAS